MIAVLLSPIYLLLNSYLLWRLLLWLGACYRGFQGRAAMAAVTALYLFFAFAMVAAFFLPQGLPKRILKMIGNYWLGVLLYASLAVMTADVIRLALKFRDPAAWNLVQHLWLHRAAGLLCAGTVCAVSLYGFLHAQILHTTNYEVTIAKNGGRLDGLRIVLAADLHLGYNAGCEQVERMVKAINAQQPDLVVIAGDIFDNEYEALDDPQRLAQLLRGIESAYGTYAVYGNHDIEEKNLAGFTFGGSKEKVSHEKMDELLLDAGITLLRDEALLINDSVYLYGRPDSHRPGRGIRRRKTPREITARLDQKKPVIVIDHEPKELSELADAGVDLDLSGHTHDGQLFPGNVFTRLTWENACGHLQKGKMHSIVTSGVGVFGPNMRVGTKAEICAIDVRFQR